MDSVDEAIALRALSGRAFEEADETINVSAGRALFFHAVHRMAPQVVGDLMGEPLRLYRPIFAASMESLPPERRGWWKAFGWFPGWGHIHHANQHDPPEIHRLRRLLIEWGDKWGLADDWCLTAAVETLAVLSAAGEDAMPAPIYYPGAEMVKMPFSDSELELVFRHRGWSPTIERWEVAEERIREGFDQALRGYRERVERLCDQEGLSRVMETRRRGIDRWDCLAAQQVLGKTYDKIGEELSAEGDESVEAIGRKVRAARRLIGLTPRADRPNDQELSDRLD